MGNRKVGRYNKKGKKEAKEHTTRRSHQGCSMKFDGARTASSSGDPSGSWKKRKLNSESVVIIDLDEEYPSSSEADIDDTDDADSSSPELSSGVATEDESEESEADSEEEDDNDDTDSDRESLHSVEDPARRHPSGHGWVRNEPIMSSPSTTTNLRGGGVSSRTRAKMWPSYGGAARVNYAEEDMSGSSSDDAGSGRRGRVRSKDSRSGRVSEERCRVREGRCEEKIGPSEVHLVSESSESEPRDDDAGPESSDEKERGEHVQRRAQDKDSRSHRVSVELPHVREDCCNKIGPSKIDLGSESSESEPSDSDVGSGSSDEKGRRAQVRRRAQNMDSHRDSEELSRIREDRCNKMESGKVDVGSKSSESAASDDAGPGSSEEKERRVQVRKRAQNKYSRGRSHRVSEERRAREERCKKIGSSDDVGPESSDEKERRDRTHRHRVCNECGHVRGERIKKAAASSNIEEPAPEEDEAEEEKEKREGVENMAEDSHSHDENEGITRAKKQAKMDKPKEVRNIPKDSLSHGEDEGIARTKKEDEPEEVEDTAEDSRSGDEDEGIAHTEKRPSTGGKHDIWRLLVESVLGRGKAPVVEAINELLNRSRAQSDQLGAFLPLKFGFEDEAPKVVEKTEHEKEMEYLFAELDRMWALSELKYYTEADEDAARIPVNETQSDRCRRGAHELILRDDEGLVCKYCNHVELGPKEVMPQWADNKARRGSYRERQPHEIEHLPEIEGADVLQYFADLAAGDSCDGDPAAEGPTVWNIIPGVRETMYEHQQEGFEFLWKNLAGSINLRDLKGDGDGPPDDDVGGCIISHAPGTGKTRLTIVFLETYLKIFPDSRPVIVAPAGMLLTWEEEFRKWNVRFPFINLNSPEASSALENRITMKLSEAGFGGIVNKRHNTEFLRTMKLYAWDTGRSVLGISYSLFEKLTCQKEKAGASEDDDERAGILRRILFEKPGLVVLDEGHTPRNNRSKIWNALLELETERRVILSGTPFQNNFCELFNTLRLVRPNAADALAHEKALTGEVVESEAVERLKAAMAPFVHVHKGTILRKNLPGLRDCVVLLKPPPLQRSLIEKSLIERLERSPNTFEFEHRVALVSVHPSLYPAELGPAEAAGSSRLDPDEGCKTRFVAELIRLSTAVDEKVLIFSQYIQPLELIKEQLKEAFRWAEGRQILHMQASLYQKQRQMLINVFNDPMSESKVMLASTRCCSEGISLVGASRVVLLDVLWNPSVERQAICRAYRIGQRKMVYTYHLMTLGTTEADKYCRQAEKERLSELVFTSSEEEKGRWCSGGGGGAPAGIEDGFLEHMVGNPRLKGMFEKIINQPKEVNLIETFGLTS